MSDTMTPAEYRAFVASMLTYPGAFSYERCAIGAATEAAEALAYVAKCRWQGHSFDRETLALELGDVLFYMAGVDEVLNRDMGIGDLGFWRTTSGVRLYAVNLEDRTSDLRWLGRCVHNASEMHPTSARPLWNQAWRTLRAVAGPLGYSLADLAALNVAKLRARYAATGGQFDAATSAGRKGDGE